MRFCRTVWFGCVKWLGHAWYTWAPTVCSRGPKACTPKSTLPTPKTYTAAVNSWVKSTTAPLRTSIIGHELDGARSLVVWFLAQEGSVKGFTRAIFSGLPTVEIARLIRDHVIPHPDLHGLYHVSAEPLNKFDLLTLVANQYGKSIDILPDETYVIDRSLNSTLLPGCDGFSTCALARVDSFDA